MDSVLVVQGHSCPVARQMANGLSCPVTSQIFPDQERNQCPCIGRWILNHCLTREVPTALLSSYFSYSVKFTQFQNIPIR